MGAEDQILFYESKHLLAEQMQKKLSEDPVFVLECDQLKQVQQECLEAMLRKTIEQKDLKRVQKYL